MTAFLDTNILIYLVDEDSEFYEWSHEQLATCKTSGPAIISDIVYAEFSAGMASKEEVDATVTLFALQRYSASDQALFKAGQAFKVYKDRGGSKTSKLLDFIIGATAEDAGAPLVTANRKDFAAYFPNLRLIHP